jgi:hypothetical protein
MSPSIAPLIAIAAAAHRASAIARAQSMFTAAAR